MMRVLLTTTALVLTVVSCGRITDVPDDASAGSTDAHVRVRVDARQDVQPSGIDASVDVGAGDVFDATLDRAPDALTCTTGASACSGSQPELCVAGAWKAQGPACATATPVCSEGKCTVCAPLSLGCEGTQPQACDSTGNAWSNVGSDCATAGETCLAGACVACNPGTAQCNEQQPQMCDASGAWQNSGAACSATQTCLAGSCQGECAPNETWCVGTDTGTGFQTCDSTGSWGDAIVACPADCCAGACTDLETDPSNCGSCGRACEGGTSAGCAGTLCNYVLAQGNMPVGIAVDSTSVYWTNRTTAGGAGTVMKVPVGGGPALTLASEQFDAWNIVVDAASVYWTSYASDGTVVKADLDGSNVTTLASGQNSPKGIALGAAGVYWTDDDFYGGAVMTTPLGGGALTTIASVPTPDAIAVGAQGLYWGDGDGALSLPLGTSTPVNLGPSPPFAIVVDATSLYLSVGPGIVSLPIGGGTPATLLTDTQSNGLAIDATSVYSTTYSGEVVKVPIAGGAPVTLAAGLSSPLGIAVDATSVYWVSYGDGTVRKAPK